MLKSVAENLWVVDHDLFAFGLHFPGRMTVVRLPSGGLWLHSPVPIGDELAGALAELGPVEHIVGPNKFHHLQLGPTKERYRGAKLWMSAGLQAKRDDLTADGVLTDDAPEGWGGVLEPVVWPTGAALSEVCFLHGPSRTLIVTDMLMNIHECEGRMSRFVYRLEGCYQRMEVPRLIRFIVKTKGPSARAAERLLAFRPERIVMAHGRIVDEGAEALLTRAMRVFKPTLSLAEADPPAVPRGSTPGIDAASP